MADLPKGTSGVQELIDRLRDEGVKAGRTEAERLLHEARQQAEAIVNKARAEAEAMETQARARIESERAAAHEAIRMAFRDTRLTLSAQVKAAFAGHVQRLVSTELEDHDFLRKLIVLVFGRATAGLPEGQPVELLLSDELFTGGEGGAALTDAGREALRHMVLGISGEMLREGVTLRPAGKDGLGGMRVRLVGQDLEIDLSDEALSELLLQYLIPRFRAIVQGTD